MAEMDTNDCVEDDRAQNGAEDRSQDRLLDRRCRGRPRVRPDEETRAIIYDAARATFADAGFAATCMDAVARRAGVSTKTLYRLVPNKAALFEGMVSERLDRFVAGIELKDTDHDNIEDALAATLIACAGLTLADDVIGLQRMILQESCKFAELAEAFYRSGIRRTQAKLAEWLSAQRQRGLIAFDDAEEAAGMLLGMMISAPQRAALYGNVPLPSRQQIEARARRCAAIFLRGCEVGEAG